MPDDHREEPLPSHPYILASRCKHRINDPRPGETYLRAATQNPSSALDGFAYPGIHFCRDCVLRWVLYAVDQMNFEQRHEYLTWFVIDEQHANTGVPPLHSPLRFGFDLFAPGEQAYAQQGWKLDVANAMLQYEAVYSLAGIHAWLRLMMPHVAWPPLDEVPGADEELPDYKALGLELDEERGLVRSKEDAVGDAQGAKGSEDAEGADATGGTTRDASGRNDKLPPELMIDDEPLDEIPDDFFDILDPKGGSTEPVSPNNTADSFKRTSAKDTRIGAELPQIDHPEIDHLMDMHCPGWKNLPAPSSTANDTTDSLASQKDFNLSDLDYGMYIRDSPEDE